ncbi:flagellar hook-basal body complex protein FliE [Microbacterium esteraromaticum]|uniref:flagellar hook-basal body complex protein FliE n=1 Tax=Microbacterium esteraromaticum TaxID=57043 RepID=UPI00195E66E9|nr:flagellar hook-basal body complex protein FliE [Microbacterium esteraromaticum]MBM7466784.1 flagellar hook-basal body complex protein FliE [Microbacterium esteraromaticum]
MDPVSGVDALSSALPSSLRAEPAPAGGGPAFASSITGAIDELRGLQSQSDALKVAAVTGDLDDIHSAMIASTRAAVTLELVAAVRNKGVDAFNEIMRMQA